MSIVNHITVLPRCTGIHIRITSGPNPDILLQSFPKHKQTPMALSTKPIKNKTERKLFYIFVQYGKNNTSNVLFYLLYSKIYFFVSNIFFTIILFITLLFRIPDIFVAFHIFKFVRFINMYYNFKFLKYIINNTCFFFNWKLYQGTSLYTTSI